MTGTPESDLVVDKEKGMSTPLGHESVEVNQALDVLNRVHISDVRHPQHWPIWKKWLIVSVYCLLQTFVTLTSTSYVSAEYLYDQQSLSTSDQADGRLG